MSELESCKNVGVVSKYELKACSHCGSSITAEPPTEGSCVVIAKCRRCDKRYYLSGSSKKTGDLEYGMDALNGFNPKQQLSPLSITMIDQLASIRTLGDKRIDRRQNDRRKVEILVVAIPLNNKYLPTESALEATTVDISVAGIAFLVPSPIEANYWLIDLGPTLSESVQLAMRPTRVEPQGSEGQWKIAGPLLSRFELV